MQELRRNVLVGTFVLAGLIALGTLIMLFGRGPTIFMQGRTYPLHIRFDSVTGIRPGNQVTLRGLPVGRVIDVRLYDDARPEDGVDVVVAIDQRYRIPLGIKARTIEPVLGQGRPPIELVLEGPSSGEYLTPGAELRGELRTAVESIFPSGVVGTFQTAARQIGDAAEELTPVLSELQKLLAARTPGEVDSGALPGNLASAVTRLDAALRHFNEVLGDPQVKSRLRETVANVHAMSEEGKQVVGDLRTAAGDGREMIADARKLIARADQTLTNLDTQTTTLAQAMLNTLNRLDTALDDVAAITRQIALGEGTIGRIVMDGKLYDALVISADRLGLALDEFRALVAEWRQGKVRVAF